MSEMTDERALDFIRTYLAPYAAHGEKDLVVEHIAARLRAAPQPPAEAQPCGCGEATCTVPWEPGCGLGKSEQHAEAQAQVGGEVVAWLGSNPRTGVPEMCTHKPVPSVMRDFNMRPLVYGDTAPPSAPVGVEGLSDCFPSPTTGYTVEPHGKGYAIYQGRDQDHHGLNLGLLTECSPETAQMVGRALTQQPAADGGFTAADMMDARQEGREEAQQLAGFSAGDMADAAAQGFRDGVASVGVAPVDGVDWRAMYRHQTAMRYMDNNAQLTKERAYRMADNDVAALELQQGGRSDD